VYVRGERHPQRRPQRLGGVLRGARLVAAWHEGDGSGVGGGGSSDNLMHT